MTEKIGWSNCSFRFIGLISKTGSFFWVGPDRAHASLVLLKDYKSQLYSFRTKVSSAQSPFEESPFYIPATGGIEQNKKNAHAKVRKTDVFYVSCIWFWNRYSVFRTRINLVKYGEAPLPLSSSFYYLIDPWHTPTHKDTWDTKRLLSKHSSSSSSYCYAPVAVSPVNKSWRKQSYR